MRAGRRVLTTRPRADDAPHRVLLTRHLIVQPAMFHVGLALLQEHLHAVKGPAPENGLGNAVGKLTRRFLSQLFHAQIEIRKWVCPL